MKQAITLITLRLGKLEVFANDVKITGGVPRSEDSVGMDKDLLLSIVSRLDNMEKMQHNLRVEIENIKNSLITVNQILDEPEELIFDINEQPVIIDILNRLSALAPEVETPEPVPEVSEISEPLPEISTELENQIVNFPVYDPNVIEPYSQTSEPEPVQSNQPEPVELVQVTQPASQPVTQLASQPVTQPKPEQNLKTPRKRGKKITIA